MSDPLAALKVAVESGRPDDAANAAAAALAANVPLLDLARAAAHAGAATVDLSHGLLPHGLMTLSSSLRVVPHLREPLRALPVLQGIVSIAADPKIAPTAPSRSRIEGEPTQLGDSFRAAVRAGNADDAERTFAGFLRKGRERRIAGHLLFRTAFEDMADGGHRILFAVHAWQLARAFRWSDPLPVLRPCLHYVAHGQPDRASFDASWRLASRAMLDREAVSAQHRSLAVDEIAALRSTLAEGAGTGVHGVIERLKAGAGPSAVADTLAGFAAERVASMPQPDFPALHAYQLAAAARFVVGYSRSEERIGALFQAAHALGGSVPAAYGIGDVPRDAEESSVASIERSITARSPEDAIRLVRAYLRRGSGADRLLGSLAHAASRSDARATTGHTLQVADVALTAFAGTNDPVHLDALVNALARAPRNETLPESWRPVLGT